MGDPMELNFEGLKLQKRNVPTDRTRKIDEKNGTIYLVIMFTRRVMVKTMSKMVFFLFSDDGSKNEVAVPVEYLSKSEFFLVILQKIGCSYRSSDIEGRNIKEMIQSIKKYPSPLFLRVLKSC